MLKPAGFVSQVLYLLLIFAAPAAALAFQNGEDGDPGTDGSDGADGLSQTFHANGDIRTSEWFGVPGTNGGNGGNGVDGDDADASASGGNGGQGGNGGGVFVGRSLGQPIPFRFEVRATAGDGGNGGLFGLGTSPELNGIGGNGGDGGFAYVGIREGKNVTTRTTGGNGGVGFGAGSSGGNGGFAYAQNFIRVEPDDVTGEILLRQTGGNGGNGVLGANGGNGATTVFGVTPDHFRIESSEVIDRPFTVLRAGFQGQGGDAGGTQDGVSGTAGHAIFFLDQMFDSVIHRADPSSHKNSSDLSVDMIGGRGGDGNATGHQSISGSNGGNAHAIVSQPFSSNDTDRQIVQVRVTGGDGGNATGTNNTGSAGNGGLAVVDDIHFDLTHREGSPIDSAISFAAILNGGHGGETDGVGNAGNGASVRSFNRISADVSGDASFYIEATAGNGGKGQLKNGHGGHAITAMDNRIYNTSNADNTTVEPVTIRAYSFGGNAGLGEDAINEANGGNAWTSLTQSSSGSVRLEAESTAGWGQFGKSGDSTARAHATSAFSKSSADARANIPKAHLLSSQPIPTIGISSAAHARATSLESSNNSSLDVAVATAVAYAGWGSEQSGNAFAQAEAYHTGSSGLAFANSNSTAFGDRNENTHNESVSVAVASSSNAAATADAATFALGHNVRNQSRATIYSVSGSARSRATSQTLNWRHLSFVENQAWISNVRINQQFVSASSTEFRRGEYGNSEGIDGKAHVVIAPESNFADSIANGTAYKDVFVDDPAATILGVGEIGAAFTDPNASGQLTFHSNFRLKLEILDFYDDANFMLGFFQDSVGNGFTDLQFYAQSGIQNIANESFSSLSEAETFFDDRLFDLGPLDGRDFAFLDFQFRMTVDNVGDGFELGFIFGNATPRDLPKTFSSFSSVPEPSALVVSFLFLGILVRRRRPD